MKYLAVLLLVAYAAGQDVAPHGVTELEHRFYEQFLRATHPNQLRYMQLLHADFYGGMIQTALHHSALHVTHDGADVGAYDWVTKILPDHSHSGFTKQDVNDRHLILNHGGPVEVRMITEGGTEKTEILGDPIQHAGAHFDVLVPHNVYAAISNLDDHSSVVTAVSAPAWVQSAFHRYTEAEMDAKFPGHEEYIGHGYHD